MAAKIVAGIISIALTVAGIFALAGRLDWIEGWAYVGLMTLGQSVVALVVARRQPELLRRRAERGKGTKAWDMACLSLFGLAYAGTLVVGALDSGRWGWSDMPLWLWPVGAALYAVCVVLLTWSMSVNAFFEKTVRIQTDRGHTVVDSGPYRFVRHPGYLGTIPGFILAVPLLLRSWPAFAPAGVAALTLVVRTALEDRFLRRELAGYDEYARRVRYRLLPGVW